MKTNKKQEPKRIRILWLGVAAYADGKDIVFEEDWIGGDTLLVVDKKSVPVLIDAIKELEKELK